MRRSGCLALLLAVVASTDARAQIRVSGVSDETVYTNSAAFSVEVDAGFTYSAMLNRVAVPVGTPHAVTAADYYELEVSREAVGGGAVESALIQFIVRDSSRGNSEWGLRPWVPLADVPSAAGEFAGAVLEVIAPRSFPSGIELPLIALVRDGAGRRVGVNGRVAMSGASAHEFAMLRGVGSTLHPALAAGESAWTISVGPLSIERSVAIESESVWTDVSGAISAPASWPDGARIRVTGDLTIAAGASLTVGADAIIVLAPGIAIEVNGTLRITASNDHPTVLMPIAASSPWGGIATRGAGARVEMQGVIITGSGANDDWFDEVNDAGSSHRDEEAALYFRDSEGLIRDSYLIDLHGQAGHGEDAMITFERCVVQRCITVGQYNRGAVDLIDCALLEFPGADAPFEDNDSDGFYLTGGAHSLTRCLIGWALDDGIDAGSGSAGSVAVTDSWFESCYHEGMAWSERRDATVRGTVSINNGQGIECGFDDPVVDAAGILSTANLIGARFGDNYDWDYEGSLAVAESLLLFNHRDTFGRNWDDWEIRVDQISIEGNFVTVPDPFFPNNALWDPAEHADRLVPFLPSAGLVAGAGIATRSTQLDHPSNRGGLPVRLSRFTTVETSIDYTVHAGGDLAASGTLVFAPGQTVARIALDDELVAAGVLRVALENPRGLELSGVASFVFAADSIVVPRGALWRYSDGGIDEGVAWRGPDFDDSAWSEGPAELGYGDDDEATEIDGGPDGARYPTVYFRRAFTVDDPAAFAGWTLRLVRDDGAVVYLNGIEVLRDNMPSGEILYGTLAEDTQSGGSEETFRPTSLAPELFRPGRNVLAIEVHQVELDSSDVSFNAELVAHPDPDYEPGEALFIRGDVNGDGEVDISDPVAALLHLFRGQAIGCEDALDFDDSGALNISDVIYGLDFLFRGGEPIPAPYPARGEDASADVLGCETVG